jgi:hypothetical protein
VTWNSLICRFWMNPVVTRGIILANGMVPHGPGMGCHVAPYYWFGCLKYYGVRGDRTPDLPHRGKVFAKSALPTHHTMCLVIYMTLFIFELECIMCWGASGLGLSPSPRSHNPYPYDHSQANARESMCVFSNG